MLRGLVRPSGGSPVVGEAAAEVAPLLPAVVWAGGLDLWAAIDSLGEWGATTVWYLGSPAPVESVRPQSHFSHRAYLGPRGISIFLHAAWELIEREP